MATSIFETDRLIGRHVERADAEAMHAVYGDPEVVRFVGDGQPLNAETCKRWIEVIFKKYAQWGYGMTALVQKTDGAIVGFCGLVHPDDQVETEVKYALRRDSWGRGFATEAVSAMLTYGTTEFSIDYIIATVNPSNRRSQRVLDKAGMNRCALRQNADGTSTQLYTWRKIW